MSRPATPDADPQAERFDYVITWSGGGRDDPVIDPVQIYPNSICGRGERSEISSGVQACIEMFAHGPSKLLSITISRVPLPLPAARKPEPAGKRLPRRSGAGRHKQDSLAEHGAGADRPPGRRKGC